MIITSGITRKCTVQWLDSGLSGIQSTGKSMLMSVQFAHSGNILGCITTMQSDVNQETKKGISETIG